MKRITYYLMKGSESDGYYLKPGVSCEEARERIGIIEDILGEDYDLNCLRELIEESKNLSKMLKVSDNIWYVDFEEGNIERGKVETVNYKNKKLDCFSVYFENGDFDVFNGSAWGKCFFGSELSARKALLKGENNG